MHIRIAGSADQPLRCLRLRLAEALMDAGDHHVQFGQQIIRKIELAVLQDVHFRAGEQAKFCSFLGQLLVDVIDLLELLPHARGVQAVGLEGSLGVISDCPVGQPKFAHRFGNLFGRLMSIAPG